MGVPTKTCTKCGRHKSVTEFHVSERGLHGVRADCKPCVKLRQQSVEVDRLPDGSLKQCHGCGLSKPISEFQQTRRNKSGYRPRCTECKRRDGQKYARTHRKSNHRQYRKLYSGFQAKEARRAAHRRERLKSALRVLKENPCLDCGDKLPYYCMDFDHLPGEMKKASIKDLSRSPRLRQVLNEVTKCELVCVNCHRLRTVRRYEAAGLPYFSPRKRHRQLLIREKSKPCSDCGHMFHPAVMEFDHVRGEKVDTLARLVSRFGEEKLLIEMAKCDIVCACCHRMRTFNRQSMMG